MTMICLIHKKGLAAPRLLEHPKPPPTQPPGELPPEPQAPEPLPPDFFPAPNPTDERPAMISQRIYV